jgi:hypothetical protein
MGKEMIVAVQGTNEFNDYGVFIRSMGVAMSNMNQEDNEFIIYSAGPAKVNSFVSEFSNVSEKGMKARGKKIKFYKVAPLWMKENLDQINYFAFLSKPNEKISKLVSDAQLKNIEIGIFKY